MDEKETSPSRFECEMTRMMELVILKLGGFETRFDGLEKNVSEIKTDVQVIKGQFSDVAVMAI
ncbi:MAG: hypothetical protein ABJA66_18035 [Actinomycetota bacterium]